MKQIGILIIAFGLVSACSVKDAKNQKVNNEPMKISAKNKLELNLADFRDSGRINIEKAKHGTFVALLWPKFEGTVTQQSKAFGSLAAKLLDLVKDASVQKADGFKFEDSADLSFDQFKSNKCQDFIWRDFVLGETFQDNFDPYLHLLDDGIANAKLNQNDESVPHDLAVYDFKIVEIKQGDAPVPANYEETRKWITESMADTADVNRYKLCSQIRSAGLVDYDKSKELIASASDNLVYIKYGINCYEKKKAQYEISTAENLKNSNFIDCREFFGKQGKLDVNARIFATVGKPDFSKQIHANWIDTNEEGIDSELSWGSEENVLRIKGFDGLSFSSVETEYVESDKIYPVAELTYDIATQKLSFYLDNPNTAVRYSISAKQVPLESSGRAEFGGDIEATCIPGGSLGSDIELCERSLNGHQSRGGLFMFKGTLR